MDISAYCDRTDETGAATSGCLRWVDTEGNRYHIWVHRNPEGTWQLTEKMGTGGKFLYKNPPRGTDRFTEGYFPTKYLDHTAKAHAATVTYVLEQQNAHGIVEIEAAQQAHIKAAKLAEARKATADKMREGFQKVAAEMRAEGIGFGPADLDAVCGLDDDRLNTLFGFLMEAR